MSFATLDGANWTSIRPSKKNIKIYNTMGTRARPSRKCEECRIKRRRCDFKTPGCSQCLRASVECSGYKDAFTLRLRDETSSTAHRVQTRKTRLGLAFRQKRTEECDLDRRCNSAMYSSSPSSSSDLVPAFKCSPDNDYDDDNNDDQIYSDPEVFTVIEPLPNIDQAALAFFMHNFAIHSSFWYLPKFYNTLLSDMRNLNPMVAADDYIDFDQAIAAAGMVMLSHELKQPSLLASAHARYAGVLAATQKALSDPDRAMRDSVLASILLLSLVEALTFHGRDDPSGWDAHTLGAATLLQMRGAEQLHREVGRELYLHASAQIRRRCAIRAIEVPNAIQQLTRRLAERCRVSTEVATFQLRLSQCFERFTNLRADIQSCRVSCSNWIQRIVAIGDNVDDLFTTIRQDSPFHEISLSSPSAASIAALPVFCTYGDVFYEYSSSRVAKRWNDIRMVRLFVGEIARDCVRASMTANSDKDGTQSPSSTLSAKELADVARLTQAARDAAVDVLHSIPYLLHLSSAPRLLAIALVLPLSSIAIAELLPFVVRSFARDRLQYIGDKLGIVQATESWHMVQEKENLERWLAVLHII